MKIRSLGLLAALVAATAVQAQESDLSIVVGVKTWSSQWTSSLLADGVITQEPAKRKVIAIPQVAVRWNGFVASVSGMAETEYDHDEGGLEKCRRKERDANLGYQVLPGLTTTLGYKKFTQSIPEQDTNDVHRPTSGTSAIPARRRSRRYCRRPATT